jgi:hypothetical protein
VGSLDGEGRGKSSTISFLLGCGVGRGFGADVAVVLIRTPTTQFSASPKLSTEPNSVQTRLAGGSRLSSEKAAHLSSAAQRLTQSSMLSAAGERYEPRNTPAGIRLPHNSPKPAPARVDTGVLHAAAGTGALFAAGSIAAHGCEAMAIKHSAATLALRHSARWRYPQVVP